MASTISNPFPTNTLERRRKKRKKTIRSETENQDDTHIKWKSEQQQQIYSSKLLRALSSLRISQPDSASAPPRRGKAVREAADRALAVSAKGRTRWSRAILTNRVKLKFRKVKRQRGSAAAAAAGNRSKKPTVSVVRLKGKTLPAVQRKVKVLGRLVPGCRKQPLPVILEEATDYIAALEMQVRAMSALAEFLSGGSGSSSGSNPVAPS